MPARIRAAEPARAVVVRIRFRRPPAGRLRVCSEPPGTLALAEEMQALAMELVERVRATGLLRDDVTYLDVEFLLEFLASVKLGNTDRTAELRQRHLAVVIDGLRTGGRTPLPSDPPTWEEQTQRWLTH
jgi:hypothetical protein